MSMSRFQGPDDEHEEHAVHDQTSAEGPREQAQAPPPHYKRKRKSRRGLFIVMFLMLIGTGAGAAFYLFGLLTSESEAPASPAQTETTPQETIATISDTTERYRSSRFLLSLDIPTDWEINDTTGGTAFTATSPKVDIPNGNGTARGIVVLNIQRKGTDLTQFEAGNASAAIASEKIAYTNASASQRGETFISFLNYAESSSVSRIDGVYITGDFGYEKDQAIPEVDINKIDPNIFVEFFACDGTCDVPLAISTAAWQDAQFGAKIQNILESLTIN